MHFRLRPVHSLMCGCIVVIAIHVFVLSNRASMDNFNSKYTDAALIAIYIYKYPWRRGFRRYCLCIYMTREASISIEILKLNQFEWWIRRFINISTYFVIDRSCCLELSWWCSSSNPFGDWMKWRIKNFNPFAMRRRTWCVYTFEKTINAW